VATSPPSKGQVPESQRALSIDAADCRVRKVRFRGLPVLRRGGGVIFRLKAEARRCCYCGICRELRGRRFLQDA
jgi:hypothetical protein